MIYEYLAEGIEHARTGKELAALFDTDIRNITEQIEKERKDGYPICASCRPDKPGYYLAASGEELEDYCRQLQHREDAIKETRTALVKILEGYAATKST